MTRLTQCDPHTWAKLIEHHWLQSSYCVCKSMTTVTPDVSVYEKKIKLRHRIPGAFRLNVVEQTTQYAE